jgi:hypothetical protein
VNCGFKAFSRQFREADGYSRVLKRQVIDVIPGGMSPAIDPNSAEVAVSIEDQERFFRGLPDTQVQTHAAFIASGLAGAKCGTSKISDLCSASVLAVTALYLPIIAAFGAIASLARHISKK